jgi:glucan-binding YG repeat protein
MKARYLTYLGTAVALAMSCTAAFAQSNTVSREIKLSQASGSSTPNQTQPAPVAPRQSAPAPGTAQPPQSLPPGQQAPQTQVSQDELKKFASAIKKLQPIQQEAETQITQAIQQQELSEQRFGEIYQSRQNPKAKPTTKITPEENKKFEQASTRIQKIQESTQSRMEKTVQGEGLDIQRFNQIFLALRQNPQLLEQVRQMIKTAS